MANLPLAFAELLVGAILLDAAYKGDTIGNVVKGQATMHPVSTGSNGGGTAATDTSGVTLNSNGYVNPLAKAKGVTAERTDMGKDYSMSPGSPILAIGNGIVKGITQNWYNNQPYVAIQLTSGTKSGQTYYVAEQINPSVSPGQQVLAGEQIGTYASSGTGIETGWANPNNWAQTLAQGTTGYVEGEVTKAGQAFTSFLQSLGAPV